MSELRKLLRPPEMAALLNISIASVYGLSERGLLPCIKISKCLRFDGDAVLDWFKNGGFEKAKRDALQGKHETTGMLLSPISNKRRKQNHG